MSSVTIWHNPRCSKSRQGLAFLEESGASVDIIRYLDTPPTAEEIRSLLNKLGISAHELMRTKEAIYKELDLKNIHDEKKLIEAMAEHPKLIERPVFIMDGKAIIGRPPEKVIEFVKG